MHLDVPSRGAPSTRSATFGRLRRLTVRAVVATMAVAAVAVVATAQPAHAAGPAPIVNYNSGLCLQPVSFGGSIYDDGVPIWQVPCNGSLEQNWTKVFLSDGHKDCPWWFPIGRCGFDPVLHVYYLVNQLTGKCMDVTDARGDNRAPIQQWQCNNGGSEKWWLPPSDGAIGTFVPFQNFRTGKCLDVPGGAVQSSNIQQYSCTANNGAQLFTLP